MTKSLTQTLTTPTSDEASINAFEAQGKKDGMLSDDGFFVQDDWEFELNALQDRSRVAIQEHLDKGPIDHDTVVFIKGYLMNSRDVKFTAFEE